MLKKAISKTGRKCRVTFKYPNDEGASCAAVAGEFNGWDISAHPMKRLKDGSFSCTISLDTGRTYRFRYVLDNETWVNEPQADGYVPNEYGEEDSLLRL